MPINKRLIDVAPLLLSYAASAVCMPERFIFFLKNSRPMRNAADSLPGLCRTVQTHLTNNLIWHIAWRSQSNLSLQHRELGVMQIDRTHTVNHNLCYCSRICMSRPVSVFCSVKRYLWLCAGTQKGVWVGAESRCMWDSFAKSWLLSCQVLIFSFPPRICPNSTFL